MCFFSVLILSCNRHSSKDILFLCNVKDKVKNYYIFFVKEDCDACNAVFPIIRKFAFLNPNKKIFLVKINDKKNSFYDGKTKELIDLQNVKTCYTDKPYMKIQGFPTLVVVNGERILVKKSGVLQIKSFLNPDIKKRIKPECWNGKYVVFLKENCECCQKFVNDFLFFGNSDLNKKILFVFCSDKKSKQNNFLPKQKALQKIKIKIITEDECLYKWDIDAFPCVMYFGEYEIINYGNISAMNFCEIVGEER